MSVVDDNPFSLQRPILIVLVLVLARVLHENERMYQKMVYFQKSKGALIIGF